MWIKMEDRMPEEDCQILCSNGSDICLSHSNLLTRHADDDALYAPALYGRGLRVLYWMPVPPLPEGGKTE